MGTFYLEADGNQQSAKKCFSRALAADATCSAAGAHPDAEPNAWTACMAAAAASGQQSVPAHRAPAGHCHCRACTWCLSFHGLPAFSLALPSDEAGARASQALHSTPGAAHLHTLH